MKDAVIERYLCDLRTAAPHVEFRLLRMLAVLLASRTDAEWLLLASDFLTEDGRDLLAWGRPEGTDLLRLAEMIYNEAGRRTTTG